MEQVRVFLDTDILLDYFTGRMGDGVAEKVVLIGGSKQYRLCISPLTGVNVLYVSVKMSSKLDLEDISSLFEILPMTPVQWRLASSINSGDPEDDLQIACALDNDCKLFITRDKGLLAGSRGLICAMSPEEFIRRVL